MDSRLFSWFLFRLQTLAAQIIKHTKGTGSAYYDLVPYCYDSLHFQEVVNPAELYNTSYG